MNCRRTVGTQPPQQHWCVIWLALKHHHDLKPYQVMPINTQIESTQLHSLTSPHSIQFKQFKSHQTNSIQSKPIKINSTLEIKELRQIANASTLVYMDAYITPNDRPLCRWPWGSSECAVSIRQRAFAVWAHAREMADYCMCKGFKKHVLGASPASRVTMLLESDL